METLVRLRSHETLVSTTREGSHIIMILSETTMESPLGPLRLLADDKGLRGLYYQDHKNIPNLDSNADENHPVLSETRQQLEEYFCGERRDFELPLSLQGTPFMLEVWEALGKIPFGAKVTYGQLAESIGRPKASRAVGRANGLNPISIVLPCHRVVGSNGKLTGYAGGLGNKDWLLRHEKETRTARMVKGLI